MESFVILVEDRKKAFNKILEGVNYNINVIEKITELQKIISVSQYSEIQLSPLLGREVFLILQQQQYVAKRRLEIAESMSLQFLMQADSTDDGGDEVEEMEAEVSERVNSSSSSSSNISITPSSFRNSPLTTERSLTIDALVRSFYKPGFSVGYVDQSSVKKGFFKGWNQEGDAEIQSENSTEIVVVNKQSIVFLPSPQEIFLVSQDSDGCATFLPCMSQQVEFLQGLQFSNVVVAGEFSVHGLRVNISFDSIIPFSREVQDQLKKTQESFTLFKANFPGASPLGRNTDPNALVSVFREVKDIPKNA